MKYSSSARSDRENLYLGNLNTVAHDLVLPTTGPSGAEISWKSDQPRYLKDNGKVTRPKFGMGDRDVQLTAVFRDEKETVEKTYTVHILEDENRIQVREIPEILLNGTIGVPVDPPSAVPVITQDGDMVIQPVAWKVKNFASDQPGLYEINGLIRGTSISVTAKVNLSANASAEPVVPRKKREAFARNEVRLDPDSLFYDQQERMHQFLLTVDDDRMLYNFRKACGLSTKDALPLQGWDSPSCQLRGHTTGHYLSALSLCYEATGDSLIREKALYLVSELQACQGFCIAARMSSWFFKRL